MPVERLGERMVGGRVVYRELSTEARDKVRKGARRLHHAGLSTANSDSFMSVDKAGFVYIITHPSWPNHVKVGRACDPIARLSGYQTGCPHRSYELQYAIYFADCYQAELEIHARMEPWREQGEWFNVTVEWAASHIRQLREIL